MNYSNWYLYKSFLFSIVLLYFNCFAAWSGITFFDNLYYGLYDVDMTNFAIGFYCLFEQDISFRFTNQEEKLNFKLSHYYGFCRDEWLRKFIPYYISWFCYGFASAVAIFFVPAFAYRYASVDSMGHNDGFATLGFVCFTLLIVVHHGMLFLWIRNWTYIISFFAVLSVLFFFPINVLINNGDPSANGYAITLTDSMREP